MNWTIDFIHRAVGGDLLSSPCMEFQSYSTDSRDRKIQGSFFIALVGDHYDAHDFIPKAVEEAGVRGVLCHRWEESWEPLKQKASFIRVPETLKALHDLAFSWRGELSAKVMAITGSNGKTTTKDFLYQILSCLGKTRASLGSFNNHWGLPFTILNTQTTDQYCVLEMGMNHPGEITSLNHIARPDMVTVVNVGQAHLGHFENGIQGVAKAKEEIYLSAPKEARFVFNIDNSWTQKMSTRYDKHFNLCFSNKNPSADVYLRVQQKTQKGFIIEGHIGGVRGQVEVNFWGEQNLENLAAATCLACGAGVEPKSLWQYLNQCHTGWGRNQWLELKSGGPLLFDGYNANPDSFKSLLENLENRWDQGKQYIALFGEMLELGDKSGPEHRQLGQQAGRLPWSHCVFMGSSGACFQEGWEASKNKVKPIILNGYKEFLDLCLPFVLNKKAQVIVKGSRGGTLEKVVEQLNPLNFPPKSI